MATSATTDPKGSTQRSFGALAQLGIFIPAVTAFTYMVGLQFYIGVYSELGIDWLVEMLPVERKLEIGGILLAVYVGVGYLFSFKSAIDKKHMFPRAATLWLAVGFFAVALGAYLLDKNEWALQACNVGLCFVAADFVMRLRDGRSIGLEIATLYLASLAVLVVVPSYLGRAFARDQIREGFSKYSLVYLPTEPNVEWRLLAVVSSDSAIITRNTANGRDFRLTKLDATVRIGSAGAAAAGSNATLSSSAAPSSAISALAMPAASSGGR